MVESHEHVPCSCLEKHKSSGSILGWLKQSYNKCIKATSSILLSQ